MYGHETGLDVDDPDGYAYGVSTYHFNMYIAGLVKEIDKGFSYVPYIGFGKTGREIREKGSCTTGCSGRGKTKTISKSLNLSRRQRNQKTS